MCISRTRLKELGSFQVGTTSCVGRAASDVHTQSWGIIVSCLVVLVVRCSISTMSLECVLRELSFKVYDAISCLFW